MRLLIFSLCCFAVEQQTPCDTYNSISDNSYNDRINDYDKTAIETAGAAIRQASVLSEAAAGGIGAGVTAGVLARRRWNFCRYK